MTRIGFIGAGTVATALACGLSRQGYTVVAISSRSQVSAEKLARLILGSHACRSNQDVADQAVFVFITTPDDIISSVVEQIVWHPDQAIVHCSGADSSAILAPAQKAGAQIGVFHPLQTFAGAAQAVKNLSGITFALEAEEPLLSQLKTLATALSGRWIVLRPQDKVLYHASAVLVSNYLVTLVKLASDLWQEYGIPQAEAVQALLPLVKGTVDNLEITGLPQCLTGPIARGDIGTITKHLDALGRRATGIETIYRELGQKTISIALAKGRIDSKKARQLEAVLKSSQE